MPFLSTCVKQKEFESEFSIKHSLNHLFEQLRSQDETYLSIINAYARFRSSFLKYNIKVDDLERVVTINYDYEQHKAVNSLEPVKRRAKMFNCYISINQ